MTYKDAPWTKAIQWEAGAEKPRWTHQPEGGRGKHGAAPRNLARRVVGFPRLSALGEARLRVWLLPLQCGLHLLNPLPFLQEMAHVHGFQTAPRRLGAEGPSPPCALFFSPPTDAAS